MTRLKLPAAAPEPGPKPDPTTAGLPGNYFHSMNGTKVEWQGHVLCPVGMSEEWFLVELFDWIMGDPSCRRAVHIGEMKSWRFYPNADSMNDWYTHWYKPNQVDK